MADISVTPANVELVSGSHRSGVAGEAISAGQALFIDTTDSNQLKKLDVDLSAAASVCCGIAISNASTSSLVVYALPESIINTGATLVAGTRYYGSDTAGGIKPGADLSNPDYVTYLFTAIDTATARIAIDNTGVQL